MLGVFVKMSRVLLALLFVAVLPSYAAAETAGAVSFVIGEANTVDSAGKQKPLVRGDNVDSGQIIVTGSNGHVHLRMVDGAFFSVRPASRLRIEDYHFDQNEPAKSRIKFSLEHGIVRSITGRAGEASKESYRLNTPLAAIGIRGTDFVVQADSELTRVIVQSGAIVLSPLDKDCSATSFGPCKSSSTRILTAAMHDAYLELRNRHSVPLLVPAEKGLESPNLLSPPRPEEPRPGADKAAKVVPAVTPAVVVDASSAVLAGGPVAHSGAIDLPVVVVPIIDPTKVTPPVVVVPPVVVPPVAQQIWWGRWESLAGADGRTLKSVLSEDRETTSSNAVFGMLRDAGEVTLPNAGVAKFRLADSESFLFAADNSLTAAKISAPSLSVDFGNRRYDTSLTVSAAGISDVAIESSGRITAQGYFISEVNSAGTTVDGALSRNGSQAGYLFQRQLAAGNSVVGATRWIH